IHEQQNIRRADAVCRDQDPDQDAVWVPFEEMTVLVNARLALLGVDEQNLPLSRRRPGRRPFGTNREIGTAPTTQPGRLDELLQLGAIHRPRPLEGAVRLGAWLKWVDPADGPQQPRLAGPRPCLAPAFPRFAPIATDRRRLPAVAGAADTSSLSGYPADGAAASPV